VFYISQLLSPIYSSHYYSQLSPKPHVYKKSLILLLGKDPGEVYDGSQRGNCFETERCVQTLPHCVTGGSFTCAAIFGNKPKSLLPSHGMSGTLLHLLWILCNSNIRTPLFPFLRNQYITTDYEIYMQWFLNCCPSLISVVYFQTGHTRRRITHEII
jgi:hypothetical protein